MVWQAVRRIRSDQGHAEMGRSDRRRLPRTADHPRAPEKLKRWTGDQYDLAKAELAKYSCSYRKSGGYMFADEYALEYCNTDEDGEFLDGSDLDLAEKEA